MEIRLNVLNNSVDKFVLVEASLTYQGNSKSLYYQENKERFKEFHNKIIHIVVENYPSSFFSWGKSRSWTLEEHQRNQISRGLTQCKPDDVIIISDLDEIPTPQQVNAGKTRSGILTFKQMNFYYFLNCRSVDDSERWWYGTVMTHFKNLGKPQDARGVSKAMNADHGRILKDRFYRFKRALINPILKKEIFIIDDGGWHFGFLGGVKKIIEKLEAFSHVEYNKPEFKNEEAIMEAINSGKDILGRDLYCEFIPIDETYPDYLIKNVGKYSHLIKQTEA